MKILGIDVGIAITGYGLIEKNANVVKYISHGVISTSKFDTTSQRLNTLHKELKALLELEKPDVVGVEQLFFFRNTTTIITVGEARGVILLALEEVNIVPVEITPLQVKQFISSYGRANKKDVQEMVKKLLSLDFIPKPDDAADALAIAICSSYLSNYKKI
ncbi:MAG: crossover junction endodeoxyribonuclease RuvC [bacterium]